MREPFELLMETNGNCFLCSGNIGADLFSPQQSLQTLSRYAKLDLAKAMFGDEPTPSHLKEDVQNVQNSSLKAELCDECAVINAKFAEVFMELEKVKMKATFWLRCILDRLDKSTLEAAKTDDDITRMHNLEGETIKRRKLQLSETLRSEILTKCSLKIRSLPPQLQITKLTEEELKEQTLKPGRDSTNVTEMITCDDVKVDTDLLSEDCDGNDYLDNFTDPSYQPQEESATDDEDVSEDFSMTSSKTGGNDCEDKEVKNISEHIPDPVPSMTPRNGTEIPVSAIRNKCRVNPESRKFECCDCSMQFAVINGFIYHYQSKHLKMRYKCPAPLCQKTFSQKNNYNEHYQSAHSGVRYKCMACLKTFGTQRILKEHQQAVHGGIRYECKVCLKSFSNRSSRDRHLKLCLASGNGK